MLKYAAGNLELEMDDAPEVFGRHEVRVWLNGEPQQPHVVEIPMEGEDWTVVIDPTAQGGCWWETTLPGELTEWDAMNVLLRLVAGAHRHRELWDRFERAYREGLLHETARELFGG